MKRRGARPFMVEVKGARTARTLQAPSDLRLRPDTSLWQELLQAEVKPPPVDVPAAAAPHRERKEPEAPVRRVLPSLVPMFEIPSEVDEPASAEPPARRPRAGRTSAVAQAPVADPAAGSPAKPRPSQARPAPDEPAAPVPPAEPGPGPSPRPATWRRTKELRLGERWKRRLPHFAR